jgi:tetratricopeptide (TPR) repeat protein
MADRKSSTKKSPKATGAKNRVNAQAETGAARHTPLLASIQGLSPARTILVICLLSFLAYANSLGGAFVFDDTEQIVENQDIRSWNNLAKAFTTHVWEFRQRPGTLDVPPPLPYYRPLFTVMLTAEFHLFGLWPQGWHLVSLLLHILCAVGVFYVALLMSGRNLIALFASVLFAVHPVHAESVSWISGMTDPLFGVFFLASFYLYLKARATGDRRTLVISLAMLVLSAFAKETALSLVVLVFGYALVSSDSKTARLAGAAKRALPYAAVALIYLIPRYLVLGEMMWRNPQAPDRPLAHALLTIPFVVGNYVGHLVWPVGLSVTYDTHFITSIASPSFLFPAGGLVVFLAALTFYRKRISREIWKGLLLIAVPLLPVLNLGQVSREEYLIFDHYLYIPVAGLTYILAVALYKLGSFEASAKPITSRLRHPASAFAIIGVIALASTLVAARENRPWTDSYTLWSNVARVRPNYWAAHYNAGLALLNAKRFDEARTSLERSRELKPDEANVMDALGRTYEGLGDVPSAIASFNKAIEIDPGLFESHNNLGTVYFKSGNYALAESNFSASLRVKPEASASRFNLGLCYARQGRYSDATRELERVVDEAPGDAEAFYELGLTYERTGRTGDAIHAIERGARLAKNDELAARISEALNRLRSKKEP